MRYFDTHCHLNGKFYKTDNIDQDVVTAIEKQVMRIILPGTGKDDSLLAIEMAKAHPEHLFATVGVHPSDAVHIGAVAFLDDIDPKSIVAVGETGLDLHYEDNPHIDQQIEVFEKQIAFAQKHDLPIIVHSRDAVEQTYNILKKHNVTKFVMHSFSETYEWAMKFIELGGYISFSGVLTFKNANALREVAKKVPLDRIVCETDAPFLTPVPHRGEDNKPAYVKHVVDAMCLLREEKEDVVWQAIYDNSCKLFNIKS